MVYGPYGSDSPGAPYIVNIAVNGSIQRICSKSFPKEANPSTIIYPNGYL